VPPRERELVLRLAVERVAVLRAAFAAPVERFVAGFFAADERVEAAPVDLARVEVLRAPELFRAGDLRVEALRAPPERVAPALLRDAPDDEPVLALASPSIDHLPDITRCAASATASAIIEPSLVALDIMFVAAVEAVSAASSPASRILRRAAGLALIAAAAAARPAASISLLIAALASLSTVSLREEEPEEAFLVVLAIA
jgi:hypothetical protein